MTGSIAQAAYNRLMAGYPRGYSWPGKLSPLYGPVIPSPQAGYPWLFLPPTMVIPGSQVVGLTGNLPPPPLH